MAVHFEPIHGLMLGAEFEPCDECVLFVLHFLWVRVIVSIDLDWRWPWLDD